MLSRAPLHALTLAAVTAALALTAPAAPAADGDGVLTVPFTLDAPAYVTLVIDDAEGRRVRNLIAETRFPAGPQAVVWDGFDDSGRRVEPGAYQVRGLRHEGFRLYYEFSVNSAGNPPWFTDDRSGAWMADHSLPAAAVFLPRGVSPYGDGQPQVMLSGIVAECGDPTIFADLRGQKLYGDHYFGWDGCAAAARDVATTRPADVFLYQLIGYEGHQLRLRGITRAGAGVELLSLQTRNALPREPANIGIALAVHDGLAVASVPLDDELVFIDLARREVVARVPMPKPRGLCFTADGALLVITDGQVKRYAVERGAAPALRDEVTVVKAGLEAPYAVPVDARGLLFVSDHGKSHQVKVFTPQGRAVRTIGKPGGPQLGRYDELRMHQPQGLALDDRGQLWVAEFDAWPKRVSVWDAASGRLVKAMYGPPHYGGGGTIDPADKTRFFYSQYGNLMLWKLDWARGTAKLHSIPVRRELMGSPEDIHRWHVTVPERPMRVGGRTYLVPTFSGFLRWNDNTPFFLLGDDDIAWPVAFVGTLRRWGMDIYRGLDDVVERYPVDPTLHPLHSYNDTVVTWSDSNLDRRVQADEFTFRQFPELSVTGPDGQPRRLNRKELCYTLPDLSGLLSWNMRIDAPRIDARGVPTFDLSNVRPLIPPQPRHGGEEEGGGGFLTPSGQLMVGFLEAVDNTGRTLWSYPAADPKTPPQKGGDLHEPTRLLGPVATARQGQAGEWYALNGERGNIFLLTTDGLFIQTLGGHLATTPLLKYPTAKRGMLIDSPEQHVSFEAEHFHPTITQTDEGEVYLVAGKEHSSIFRVTGFDTVRRLAPAPLSVTAAQLEGVPARRAEERDNPLAHTLPVMIGATPVAVDGKLDEWPAATARARLDHRASCALRVVGDTLYLAFRTGDPDALRNSATNRHFLFKHGGALDLHIRPENLAAGFRHVLPQVRRLLIAQVRGQATAVLYFPETDATPDDRKVLFESPIGKVRFDAVRDVSGDIQLAGVDGNFEAAVPLKLLGFDRTPSAGQEALADVGLIRGNGTSNTQRLLWHNTDTLLVSDIPSEARLVPANWGRFRFVPDVGVEDGSVLLAPEKARRVGAGLQLKNLPRGEHAVGFWSNADDYLEWPDVAVTPGRYRVELTFGCGNNLAHRFTFAAGDQALDGQTAPTGGWDAYATVALGVVDLTEPRVTFALKARTADNGLMDFKALRLTPASH